MATGGSRPDPVAADDTANKQTCAICLEKYRRPKMLRCFHTFCQSCLQGVAGPSPSFPCPSCRKVQLLPPGGVRELQSNFYIEEDLASTSASPPPRPCHVCADDREATHTCLQCQQRYCLPCRQNHDSFTLSRGHSVVPLSPQGEGGGEEGCGQGTPLWEKEEEAEMCPRHARQELLLHCRQCQTDLCLQCKLTQHEGHPTEDMALTRSRAKDRLKDRLGTLGEELQQIDHLAGAFHDRCSKLRQQEQTTEQAFRARAARLRQWVDQSVEEAVSSLQSSCQQRSTPWREEAEGLGHRKLQVLAQQEHILRVLKRGKEADIVSLEAELSSSSMDELNVKRMETELTRDIPTFRVEHSTTAVNQPQLRAFIGVLEPEQQTAGTGERAVPCQPSGVEGMVGTDSPSSASSRMGVVVRKSPRELIYSENPQSEVGGLSLMSHKRLWVTYIHTGNSPWCLKLFNVDGKVLTTVENPRNSKDYVRILPITDDIILSWAKGSSTVQLITPDGSLSHHDLGTKVQRIVPCATNSVHFLREVDKKNLHRVKFTLGKADQTDNTESGSTVTYPKSPAAPPSGDLQLTHSVSEVVFDDMPSDKDPIHVSAGGRYFAFFLSDRVEVYSRAGSRSSTFTCSYMTKSWPLSVRFCLIDGQEMLLVAVLQENKVHVIDHTEGGRFVRYLDTGPMNLHRPCRLATDFDQSVWIGCDGGKVVVVDL